MNDRGLVSRLVAATLLAGLVTAVAGTILLRASARDALRAQVEDRLVRVAERMATGVDDRVRALVEGVELLATREAVAQLSPASTTELNVARRVLRSVGQLALYDGDGNPVAAVSATQLIQPGDIEPDPSLRGQVEDGPVVRVIREHDPMLEVIVPVEDPPGHVVGTLTAVSALDLVVTRINARVFDLQGTAFLVDGSGTIVVHPERGAVLRGERLQEPVDQGTVATREVDGVATLMASASTTAFPGAVVVQEPEDVALAPVGEQVARLTAILVAVVTVTVIAVSLVGRHLLSPLHTLAEAVSRLGRGERSVRVPDVGAGEVGALAWQFNRMADSLQEHIEELATSEARMRAILDNATSVMHVKDLDGRYVIMNRRFCELFELDPEEDLGKTDHQIFPPDMADVYRHNDLQAIRTGKAVEVEELAFHDDGDLHIYLSVKFPLRDAHGKIYGTCGISTDITQHRQAERYQRQLEEARRRRQQALELNDAVVQGLSVGLYALELGERGHAREAIESTLEAAKGVIDRLLAENEEGLQPGDLVRSEAAEVTRRNQDAT